MNAELYQRITEATSANQELDGRSVEWKFDGLPDVTGDPAMLRVVLTNLDKLFGVFQRLHCSREENDLVASYRPGVNAYVVKPVEFSRFVQAVRELGVFWAVINEAPPGSVREGP